ncbi:hypothetical protein Tco_1431251 [Tanacetum coccineum]
MFTVMNGKKSLTLNFKTFYKATSLDYNEGTYVSHTFSKAMKAELARIKTDEVLGGNYSSTVHVNSIQQLIVYCLVTRTKVDIEKINYSDLITKLTYKSRQKYVSYPRFVSCALEVLMGTEYTLDEIFGSLPNVLSNSNFTKNPSKVTPIELTTSMIAVNNLESLGPDASRTLPQNRKQPKTQKRPVVQATETSPTKKVLTEDSNKTSQSPQAKQLIPKIWRETYNSLLRDLILHLMRALADQSLCLKGKTTDPKDSKGNKHSTDKGLPATVPNESIGKTKPLPKGPRKDKYSERLKPLADMESLTPHVTVLSGTDADYQVDQTQSTRFEVSVLDQHQGKTSYEVELDFEPLKLTTIADIQALLGTFDDDLKEDSDDDVFETQEEIDEDIYEPGTKETQTRHSTKHTTKEPHSQEHQSSSLNKDQPESSKAKKNDASDS